jgi:hypothetical protein
VRKDPGGTSWRPFEHLDNDGAVGLSARVEEPVKFLIAIVETELSQSLALGFLLSLPQLNADVLFPRQPGFQLELLHLDLGDHAEDSTSRSISGTARTTCSRSASRTPSPAPTPREPDGP